MHERYDVGAINALLTVHSPFYRPSLFLSGFHVGSMLCGAGLLVRKTQHAGPKVSSSLAAVRLLFEKADENQRGNRDSLQLASLLTDSNQAAQDPSATGLPYGRYHPISMLLIRQALLPYNPSWMGVRPS